MMVARVSLVSTTTRKQIPRSGCYAFLVASVLLKSSSAYSTLFGRPGPRSKLHLSTNPHDSTLPKKAAFDAIVLDRYACKRFQRFDGKEDATATASPSDPWVVQQALHSLELARQAPSAFNTQPYKIVLVQSPERKLALSRYCLGPNIRRVLDSDCTAIFLADRQVCRSFSYHQTWLDSKNPDRKTNWKALLTTKFYILLFSSGYPLPRVLAAFISFFVRTAVSVINLATTPLLKYPLPSLASAETWATKQVMLVAMTYMLGCSSRGLATIPMEGISAKGIRKVLKVPARYSIPLIVSTGLPFQDDKESRQKKMVARRYPMRDVIFADTFGEQVRLVPQS
jgi:nitroreductase